MFCREHGIEAPTFWVFPLDECYVCHAVSLHLNGMDRWEEFDANVIFVLKDFSEREDRKIEAGRLQCMFEELGEPVLLTAKTAERPDCQQRFYTQVGLTKDLSPGLMRNRMMKSMSRDNWRWVAS